jgi:hypothetical protein
MAKKRAKWHWHINTPAETEALHRMRVAFEATPLGKRLNKRYYSSSGEAAILRAGGKIEEAQNAFIMKTNPRGLPPRMRASALRAQMRLKQMRRQKRRTYFKKTR